MFEEGPFLATRRRLRRAPAPAEGGGVAYEVVEQAVRCNGTYGEMLADSDARRCAGSLTLQTQPLVLRPSPTGGAPYRLPEPLRELMPSVWILRRTVLGPEDLQEVRDALATIRGRAASLDAASREAIGLDLASLIVQLAAQGGGEAARQEARALADALSAPTAPGAP